jgi:hypothetical protein
MDRDALVLAFSSTLPAELAEDLVDEFIAIRTDVATNTLGRSAPGRFVETLVQVLQFLETGTYDASSSVDTYLKGLESRASSLPDGLRICASRVGRAMYSLRSKRIVHKSPVDPNRYDLRFIYAGAQWVLAELVATTSGLTMDEAGRLVEQIQTPVGGLVEVLHGKHLVHANVPIPEEILLLLLSHHPDSLARSEIEASLDRRAAGSVSNALGRLWKTKLTQRVGGRYVLTEPGLRKALEVAVANVG